MFKDYHRWTQMCTDKRCDGFGMFTD